MDIPRSGRIHPYSLQFLPLLGWEGQVYLSSLGINTRYHSTRRADLRSPDKEGSGAATLGAPRAPRVAAQLLDEEGEWSSLLLGHRYLHIKIPIHSCPPPDLLGLGDNKMGGKVVGLAGAVDGPGI